MDETLRAEIAAAHAAAMDGARADALADFRATGTMTPRERVDALCDAGSFVEYGILAGRTSASADTDAADGLICGAGTVAGSPMLVAASDRSVQDGTQSQRNQRKMARLMQIAQRQRWPLVLLVDGDGARPGEPLPPPPVMVAPLGRYGLYDGLAELNGWALTIACLCGRAVDGEAGAALLCDVVVATADSVIGARAADGSINARSVADYARRGDVDVIAPDVGAAIDWVRAWLRLHGADHAGGEPAPEYARIADIVPVNRRSPYDMRKVVDAFVDVGSALELGAGFGRSMLTVLGRLDGRSIGVFANQPRSPLAGSIDVDAADKATRFIEMCDARGFPLVAFVDNPGFMVGPQSEASGMARHHARPLAALHHRRVPLCSVQVRKAYGLGPYAMSGWGTSRNAPLLRLAWPSVESGGMSLEGAAYLVLRKEIAAAASVAEGLAIRNAYADRMRDSTSGLRAGRGFQFDDVIDPTQTRERIGAMLGRLPSRSPAAVPRSIDLR